MKTNTKRTWIAMIPLAVLIVLLVFNISIFGSDSILGASQVALLVASGVCVALSMWLYKTPWEQFEGTIAKNVGRAPPGPPLLRWAWRCWGLAGRRAFQMP